MSRPLRGSGLAPDDVTLAADENVVVSHVLFSFSNRRSKPPQRGFHRFGGTIGQAVINPTIQTMFCSAVILQASAKLVQVSPCAAQANGVREVCRRETRCAQEWNITHPTRPPVSHRYI